MIEVIKHGKKRIITCPNCECEFKYDISDLETNYELTLTCYPPKYNRYIRCPDCGELIYVDTVPQSIPNPTPLEPYSPWSPGVHWKYNTEIYCDNCPNRFVAGDTCTFCRYKPFDFTVTSFDSSNTEVASIDGTYTMNGMRVN